MKAGIFQMGVTGMMSAMCMTFRQATGRIAARFTVMEQGFWHHRSV
jgi:hypothetical protein